jgi:hypothetical protein
LTAFAPDGAALAEALAVGLVVAVAVALGSGVAGVSSPP